MKRILVKYVMEIPEDRFEKYCIKSMTTKKKAIVDLRDRAEASGRVLVHKKIEHTLEMKWNKRQKRYSTKTEIELLLD